MGPQGEVQGPPAQDPAPTHPPGALFNTSMEQSNKKVRVHPPLY